jgi:branched-chain amino acid transport system permease protein
MFTLQIIANGLILGCLYASLAAGFSLVWGVLNIINLLHGSFIVLGAYLAFFAQQYWDINPFISAPAIGILLYAVGLAVQRVAINKVVGRSVLITLTLTFGLNLAFNDGMIEAFSADYRRVLLHKQLGVVDWLGVVLPVDRLLVAAESLILTGMLLLLLRKTRLGHAIIAVRMDREAAALMGIRAARIFATAFGLAAFTAGVSGALLSVIFPISPLMASSYLAKSFVVCILGGLGSIPGAIAGGILLGLVESVASMLIGPAYSTTVSFVLLLALLFFRPSGLFGKRAFA